MELTVERLGGVVVDALRAAGYMESTISQYAKTIRYLSAFVADRGGVYCPELGAAFAAQTTSPRTGRFSAQRRFDYRRLVWLIDGYLATGAVDVSVSGRGGGGPAAWWCWLRGVGRGMGGRHACPWPGAGDVLGMRARRA